MRHVGIGHAVQQAHRAADADRRGEQQVPPPLLDQRAGQDGRLLRILRRHLQPAARHQPVALRRPTARFQISASVKSGAGAMPISPATRVRPRQGGQQHDPAAHAGADQDQRPIGRVVDHRDRILSPAADRAILEPAAGGAVAGIVEAQYSPGPRGAMQNSSRNVALVPVMSDRKPRRNRIPAQSRVRSVASSPAIGNAASVGSSRNCGVSAAQRAADFGIFGCQFCCRPVLRHVCCRIASRKCLPGC